VARPRCTAAPSPVARNPARRQAPRCRNSTERSCNNPKCRKDPDPYPFRHQRCAGTSAKRDLGPQEQHLDPYRRRLPDQWTPAGDESTGCTQPVTAEPACWHLPGRQRQAEQERCRIGCHHPDRPSWPAPRTKYSPQLSRRKWLVWAATQRGQDHDIADYRLSVGGRDGPPDSAVRAHVPLGHDRWPDIFIGRGQPQPSRAVAASAAGPERAELPRR